MKEIIEALDFKRYFSDFERLLRVDSQFYAKTPRELLEFVGDVAKSADTQLPRFLKALPRKPCGVDAVLDPIAPKYIGSRYVETPKNSANLGYYWINTHGLPCRSLYTIPSLTVHISVPEHHLQGGLNNELGDGIPEFRRDLYLYASGEG